MRTRATRARREGLGALTLLGTGPPRVRARTRRTPATGVSVGVNWGSSGVDSSDVASTGEEGNCLELKKYLNIT